MSSSLLDLGPLEEEVEVRGVKLTVHGLTASDLFKLFSQFPDMRQMVEQLGTPSAVMLNLAPDVVAKVIATVTGSPGDKEVEAKAKLLGAADQMMILSAVQRLSFPQGFGPFVSQVTKLMGMDSMTPSGTGTAQGNSSHDASNAALQTDSPGLTRGTSPRVN
jgi:hypothetical protein